MKWFKHFVDESIMGTLKTECTPEERGVWWDLLELAALSRTPGIVQANKQQAHTEERLSQLMNVPLDLLQRCLQLFADQGRVVTKTDGIHIVNWKKYQSEYQRQAPYRKKKRESDKKDHGVPWCDGCDRPRLACVCESREDD